jgi:hypothetical protein
MVASDAVPLSCPHPLLARRVGHGSGLGALVRVGGGVGHLDELIPLQPVALAVDDPVHVPVPREVPHLQAGAQPWKVSRKEGGNC